MSTTTTTTTTTDGKVVIVPAPVPPNADKSSENYYWNSYAHFGIHEEMLKDTVRTEGYRDVILQNAHLFAGKVVLDVGCGTGILSMFAAKAGARLVIGVDCSDIIDTAREIVRLNGFADKIVLLKGKMEEVVLPEPKVDIIISEWMGYFLLYETMLPTVLYARDKYLVPGGLILPDKANIVLVGIEDGEYKSQKIDYWDDVYGFRMDPIKDTAYLEPLVDVVEEEAIATTASVLLNLDLATCTVADLTFKSEFSLKCTRNDYVHAFVAYFDIAFTHGHKTKRFSTGPRSQATHWKQTVFYLRKDLVLVEGDMIHGWLSCKPNDKNERDLDIFISYKVDAEHCKVDALQEFRMR